MNPVGTIIGGVLGTIFGLYSGFQQKKAADRQRKLMEKQFDLQKTQMELEEQQRTQLNQKEVDVDGLLKSETSSPFDESILQGAKSFTTSKNPLYKKNKLLGG